jgi:hypothetical protein
MPAPSNFAELKQILGHPERLVNPLAAAVCPQIAHAQSLSRLTFVEESTLPPVAYRIGRPKWRRANRDRQPVASTMKASLMRLGDSRGHTPDFRP